MIRILVVDDHPAVRAGLVAVMRTEPGLVPVASAADPAEALEQARSQRPDVALVDYHLREGDGLTVCRALKSLPEGPRVVIYSAFAGAGLSVPASVAGADGLVDKGATSAELFEAVRRVAGGSRVLPPLTPEAVSASAAGLEEEDLPIFGMLLEGTPAVDIAGVLRIDESQIEGRVAAILGCLRVRTGH